MSEPDRPEPSVSDEGVRQDQAPTEDSKVEDPKVEDSKVEDPKVEDPKVEDPKVEDPKVEDPKVEDSKVEDSKVEDSRVEDSKVEDSRVEDSKVEDSKVEDSKVEDSRVEDSKVEDSKTSEPAEVPALREPRKKTGKKSLLIGLGAGALVIVLLVLAAFVWPAFLAGPGKPNGEAVAVVAALNSKNPAELDKVSCRSPEGRKITDFPPELMQLIRGASLSAPPQLVLDTQAQAPVDITVDSQGVKRRLPVMVVLSVTNNHWCLFGIAPPSE